MSSEFPQEFPPLVARSMHQKGVWEFQAFEFTPGRWVLGAASNNDQFWPCAPEGHLGFPSAKAAMTAVESLQFAQEATGLPIVELFSNGLEFEEVC